MPSYIEKSESNGEFKPFKKQIGLDKSIRYFDEPGPQNTIALIDAVKERIKGSEIEYVVVASESGATALKVAEALKEFKVKVVCVSAYAGIRLAYPESGKWPSIRGVTRKKLEDLGVKICPLMGDSRIFRENYGLRF